MHWFHQVCPHRFRDELRPVVGADVARSPTRRDQPHAGNLRGRGMMAGIELIKDKPAKRDYDYSERAGHRIVLEARKRGMNIRAIGNLVLAVPPLTIKEEEIELLGKVLAECL